MRQYKLASEHRTSQYPSLVAVMTRSCMMPPLQHACVRAATQTCYPPALEYVIHALSNLLQSGILSQALLPLSQTCRDVKCYVRILDLVDFAAENRGKEGNENRRRNVEIVKSNMWHEGAEQVPNGRLGRPTPKLTHLERTIDRNYRRGAALKNLRGA